MKSDDANSLDLSAIARQAMIDAGFEINIPPPVQIELQTIEANKSSPLSDDSVRDLRSLLWSSIDNSESLDLDQVEYAERLPEGRIRLMIGIADVDAFVRQGSAIDQHALANTVSVYTPSIIFPMLPEQLSTNLSSLRESEDRLALVIDLTITSDGDVDTKTVYRAMVRNRAKLDYESLGEWLDGRAPQIPSAVISVPGLEAQLRLQLEATERLHALRRKNGALELETARAVPVVENGQVTGLKVEEHNHARDIIESFMIAANTSMAELLESEGVPSLRRVVREPERWSRIVALARSMGSTLPDEPDSRALSDFLTGQKEADPSHYNELSLAVLKMLGPGDYKVEAPGLEQEGHFGLAVHDYTHSTAPNRRYPDLVIQRCLKALAGKATAPYTREELEAIADRCNRMEEEARKVERTMDKAAIAVLLSKHVGETFDAIVTGVKDRGTFVRLIEPPAEGRVMENEAGLDVGDKVRVRLLSTDPKRGFIDFARVT